MLEAFNGLLYPVDILAVAVLNRSIDLLQGFNLLMKAANYLAAAPLVRLQLDNLLRFQAVWLLTDPHEFVMKVMNGTPIRELKDKDGNNNKIFGVRVKIMNHYSDPEYMAPVRWQEEALERPVPNFAESGVSTQQDGARWRTCTKKRITKKSMGSDPIDSSIA